jgi:DNA-binding NtrC family response regulator
MWLAEGPWGGPRGAEVLQPLTVRYRTVGDGSCTGAVESEAATVDEIIAEVMASRLTERGATRELADLPFKEAKEKLLGSFVREYFAEILKRSDGNLSRAARLAGIARPHLHEIVNKHGLRSVDGASSDGEPSSGK